MNPYAAPCPSPPHYYLKTAQELHILSVFAINHSYYVFLSNIICSNNYLNRQKSHSIFLFFLEIAKSAQRVNDMTLIVFCALQ